MSAPSHAVALREENQNWAELSATVACACGYRGSMYELLCIEEDETLWCPVCRQRFDPVCAVRDEKPCGI